MDNIGLQVGVAFLVVLFGLTSYGIYLGFGPPSKRLEDPFDNHED